MRKYLKKEDVLKEIDFTIAQIEKYEKDIMLSEDFVILKKLD